LGRYGHARIAVLSVIEEETNAVQRVFSLTRRVPGKPYFVADDADLERPLIVNSEVGRANLQAGGSVRDVIEHWRAEVLILCGIAGGINGREAVEVGDIVVPEYIHYSSFAKLSEKGQQLRYIAYDHPSMCLHSNYAAPLRFDDSWMSDELRGLLPQGKRPRVFIESLIAGDKVLGDPTSEEQIRLLQQFDDAVAVDMESVGLCRAVAAARLSPSYNPRLLVIRGISDIVNDEANNAQRAANKVAAATIAAIFAKRVVDDIIEHEVALQITGDFRGI